MHNSEQKIEVKFSNRKEIVYQTRDEMYRFQNFSVPIPIYERTNTLFAAQKYAHTNQFICK